MTNLNNAVVYTCILKSEQETKDESGKKRTHNEIGNTFFSSFFGGTFVKWLLCWSALAGVYARASIFSLWFTCHPNVLLHSNNIISQKASVRRTDRHLPCRSNNLCLMHERWWCPRFQTLFNVISEVQIESKQGAEFKILSCCRIMPHLRSLRKSCNVIHQIGIPYLEISTLWHKTWQGITTAGAHNR